MNKIFARKTWTKNYREDGKEYTITATANFESLSGQHPYFSITGDIKQGTRWESGGCLHDEIIKHFPNLRKYIKFHLVSTDEPMHYLANSLYWAGLQGWTDGKKNSPPNYDYLVSTCLWGILDEDQEIDLTQFLGEGDKNLPKNKEKSVALTEILMSRLSKIQTEFKYEMMKLFSED